MPFDSHVVRLVDTAARLVNVHTGRHVRGQERAVPTGPARTAATAAALAAGGDPAPDVSQAAADLLAGQAGELREVFEAVATGDVARGAAVLNRLLRQSGARPQLDPDIDGGWQVHFHGSDDSLAIGWAAGCATGLALAVGSSLAGRLGVCAADRCDDVFVDTSRNGSRRFCSVACQNRTKTAAYRARSGTSGPATA